MRFSQIEFHATRGETEFGYVAFYDVEFLQISDGCTIEPPDAVPTTTTTTSTESTTTSTTTGMTTTTSESHWSYCTFETDLCGYIIDEHAPSSNYFVWNRKTADQLAADGTEGPGYDHQGHKDSQFIETLYLSAFLLQTVSFRFSCSSRLIRTPCLKPIIRIIIYYYY